MQTRTPRPAASPMPSTAAAARQRHASGHSWRPLPIEIDAPGSWRILSFSMEVQSAEATPSDSKSDPVSRIGRHTPSHDADRL